MKPYDEDDAPIYSVTVGRTVACDRCGFRFTLSDSADGVTDIVAGSAVCGCGHSLEFISEVFEP